MSGFPSACDPLSHTLEVLCSVDGQALCFFHPDKPEIFPVIEEPERVDALDLLKPPRLRISLKVQHQLIVSNDAHMLIIRKING